MKTKKQRVLDIVSDLVGQLMYYDRKEDESLPVGEIEQMVIKGEITSAEIIDCFATELRRCFDE